MPRLFYASVPDYAIITPVAMAEDNEAAFQAVAPYYDHLMASVPYRYWVEYLSQLFHKHNHVPHKVLDLACGTGSVSVVLAQRGLEVTGVDLSEAMLQQARVKATGLGPAIDFVCGDAASFDLREHDFDTVISLFDSLNNLIIDTELESCFLTVYRHLGERGLFVFDVNTEYAFEQGMFNQKSSTVDGPVQYRWQSTYDSATMICKVTMDFDIQKPGHKSEHFREVHLQRAYPKQVVTALLQRAGFNEVAIYESYSMKGPRRRSDRLHYVAIKRPSL